MITPTFREHLLPSCLETFERQTYPNKELIIVYNGDTVYPPDLPEKYRNRKDVAIHAVPGEFFAGACLNIGDIYSNGCYCFRIDDDDLYGDNYILDMMLYLKGVDAEIFGKPPSKYFKFSDEENIYKRENITNHIFIAKTKHIRSGKVWIGGNTISYKKKNNSKRIHHYYDNVNYGSADTELLLNRTNKTDSFIFMDCHNILAIRELDSSMHTWKIKKDVLVNNMKYTQYTVKDIMF